MASRRSRAAGQSIEEFAGGPLPDSGPLASGEHEAGHLHGTAGHAGPRYKAPAVSDAVPDLPVGAPSMGPGYERIIGRVFRVDVAAEYDELEAALKFDRPAHQLDYADLVDALDLAIDNARRAHQLLVAGKVALEVFEVDVAVAAADMRRQATEALQKEKDAGARAKAITDGDVTAWMASQFADEYRAQQERRAKAKRMVEHLEWLAGLWKDRRASLDTMTKGSRRL